MFSCALSMNCRSVAEHVWMVCARPFPPTKSMNVPRTATAQTSPAAAVMRGFIALLVGVPRFGARSPFRGKGRAPALQTHRPALDVAGRELLHFCVGQHAHSARRVATGGGAEQVRDRERVQHREDDGLRTVEQDAKAAGEPFDD